MLTNSIFEAYLPIAQINANVLFLIFIGLVAGTVGGAIGIGAGFVIMPLLTFVGVSTNVAIASIPGIMLATSISSCISYAQKGRIDYAFGSMMVVGAIFGVVMGFIAFDYFSHKGWMNFIVSISYFLILSAILCGAMIDMMRISRKKNTKNAPRSQIPTMISIIPMKIKFTLLTQKVSAMAPIFIGLISGCSVSFLGLGGSIVAIPVMMYVLKAKNKMVNGTSFFHMISVAIMCILLHSTMSQSADIIISSTVGLGAAIGAQIGVRINTVISHTHFRVIFAIIVTLVCIEIAYSLLSKPASLYTFRVIR